MNRREAVSAVGFLFGSTIIGADLFLSGCTPEKRLEGSLFSNQERDLLNEIGETIIPTTDTPGAKAADVATFIDGYVLDCYPEKERQIIVSGIQNFESVCEGKYGQGYIKMNNQERHKVLLDLEGEANENAGNDGEPHYYTMIKQLVVLGYLTSEIGATQALVNVPNPGRYEACIPLKPGQKAWS